MNVGVSESGAIVGTSPAAPSRIQPVPPKPTDQDSIVLKKLTASLLQESRSSERFALAIHLRQAAQDAAVRRFPRYQQTADEEFNVSVLTKQVALLLDAERRSPYNPGTGAHSIETVTAMEQLHLARTRANQRARQLAGADVEVISALNAAEAEIRLHEAGVQVPRR
jgi:hypothetical protein